MADATARSALARLLASRPDRATVVIDGLIGSAVPELLAPHADRLRLVMLVHMPLGEGGDPDAYLTEARALAATSAAVTTSGWCRERLLRLYDLAPHRVFVARPGVDAARLAAGSPDGTRLLCAATVAPHKGHDVLVRALSRLADRDWSCVLVGRLDRDPGFVDELRAMAQAAGISDRLRLAGPRPPAEVAGFYAQADLLVLPSRGETYGMVVTEALAHGLPVLATAVGGLPEALGRAADGHRPGILVPPDDVPALAEALGRWLEDPSLRAVLSRRARARRVTLTRWAGTAEAFAAALTAAAGTVRIHTGR
jgi:glycosyltransferase involved in cell wall biosynthesis